VHWLRISFYIPFPIDKSKIGIKTMFSCLPVLWLAIEVSAAQPAQEFDISQAKRVREHTCIGKALGVRAQGLACSGVESFTKRKTCFSKVGSSWKADDWKDCERQIEPLRAEFEDEELLNYPQQGSALAALNRGGVGFAKNIIQSSIVGRKVAQEQVRPANCDAIVANVKKGSEKCIGEQASEVRRACLNEVAGLFHLSDLEQSCRDLVSTVIETLAKVTDEKHASESESSKSEYQRSRSQID
jgi:hypothetical protein